MDESEGIQTQIAQTYQNNQHTTYFCLSWEV